MSKLDPTTVALLVSDRALLNELAEQSKAYHRHTQYVFVNERYPAKAQLIAVAMRKAKDAETACKVLTAVIASAKTEDRHQNAFQDAIEGDVELVHEYFNSLAG